MDIARLHRAVDDDELRSVEVVFTGAGASMGWPSRLKGGKELSVAALQAVLEVLSEDLALPVDEIISAVAAPTGTDADGIRLEHLMGLLGRTRENRALVEVYDLLKSDVVNPLHLLIAQSGARVVTANIDLLHEQALLEVGEQQPDLPAAVVHVHGRLGDDQSIDTTIADYRRGLRPLAMREFARAVEGKAVAVIGWAGRDSDIGQAFLAHPPRRLHWFEYPGRDVEHPHADALALLDRLDSREYGFCEVSWELADATARLAEAHGGMPEPPRSVSRIGASLTASGVPRRALQAVAATPPNSFVLGLGDLLREVGRPDLAVHVVDEASRRSIIDLDGADARRAVRSVKASGDIDRAWRELWQPFRAGRWRDGAHNLNEIAAMLSERGARRTAMALNFGLIAAARRHGHAGVELTAGIRNVQLLNDAGHLRSARALGSSLITRHPPATGADEAGIGNTVNAVTWTADAYRASGDYASALELLDAVAGLIPYGSAAQLAYVQWKRAEILHLRGEPTRTVRDALAGAERDAHRAHDERVWAWINGFRADVERTTDPEAAARHLELAQRGARPNASLSAYLALQSAELAREQGDVLALSTHLRALVVPAHHSDALAGRPVSAVLAARLIVAEETSSEDPSRGRRFRSVERAYARRGMTSGAARARARLHLMDRELTLTRSRLDARWPLEMAVATRRDTRTTWPVLM